MTKQELYQSIYNWCFSVRNYNAFSAGDMTVEKTFNHGMGSLQLFHFDYESKIVVANIEMYNKSDAKKLKEFMRDNHLENWKVIGGQYDPWPCPNRVWELNVKDALKQNLKLRQYA